MAFSQAGLGAVRVVAEGPDLFVSWSSTAPPGTVFQVYVDRRLAWYGRDRRCHLPIPAGALQRNIWVEVGTVNPQDATGDFSASLTAPGGRTERAQLSWWGGTYLDTTGRDDIQGFRVYQGSAPGSAVNLSVPIDFVPAYPGGWINDGFGKGGFGGGGFGRAATLYEWKSDRLSSGSWSFAVIAVDRAGNSLGSGQVAFVTITAAPRPPAMDPGGARLRSTYSGPSNPQLTLNWLPSPSE